MPHSMHGSPTRLLALAATLLVVSCAPSDTTDETATTSEEATVTTPRPAARVLGEEIFVDDPALMQDEILSRLFDRFAAERGLEASDSEVEALVEDLQSATDGDGEGDLTPAERQEVADMRESMARTMVERWKINRALYEEYGGRIIGQQLGPEPLDAYRAFLEEARDAGNFEILRDSWRDDFWRYFTDDAMHSFYEPGSAEEAAAFETPPWERGGR